MASLLLLFSVNTYKENKKLSEELKIANNNIEAYQEITSSQQASTVLQLDMKQLDNTKDSVLTDLNDKAKEIGIKSKNIQTAATQKQVINVIQGKGVEKDTIHDLITILKDTVYTDSIKYNDLTTVNYTIGKDTVSVGLKLYNTQYLYIYKHKDWRYKSFWKRLIRFCWKKDEICRYNIINTNDLLKTSDVRVVKSK